LARVGQAVPPARETSSIITDLVMIQSVAVVRRLGGLCYEMADAWGTASILVPAGGCPSVSETICPKHHALEELAAIDSFPLGDFLNSASATRTVAAVAVQVAI
jgi:hypothetical protein